MKKVKVFNFPVFLILTSIIFCGGTSCLSKSGPKIIADPSDTSGTYTPPPGSTLVWADEFDTPDIDLSKWGYETEANGWSHTWNSEWQRYTDNGTGGDNAYIDDGVLVIKAIETTGGDGGYTSARLVTKGSQSWEYGTIVARIRMPFGQGIWPAFWMLGDSGQWPGTGEIDIAEMIGGGIKDKTIHAALHWEQPLGTLSSYSNDYVYDERLADGWHYYECEWSASDIIIRFDDVEVLTMSIIDDEKREFRQPFYILLNLAVGGTWPGPPDSTTVFPQYMFIDWVRVYQDL